MSRPEILLLHRKAPYPPSSGVDNRVWKTAERLDSLGNAVVAAPWKEISQPFDIDTLDISTPWLDWKPARIYAWNGFFLVDSETRWNPVNRLITSDVVSAVAESELDPDLVVSECLQVGDAAHRLAQQYDAPLLVDQHNTEYKILGQFLDNFEVPDAVRNRLVGNLCKYEQRMIDRADTVVFQSSEDVADFDTNSVSDCRVIPNGTEVSEIRTSDESDVPTGKYGLDRSEPTCIYVGAFDYEPNRKAADAIAETIAPACPDVTFLLVGRNPPFYDRTNIVTTGFVDDIGAFLQYADVALCPLTMGSGTKLKMLDYLAAELPIVTTSIGLQGLELHHGEHVVRVDRIEEFPEAVQSILESPERRRRLQKNCHDVADQYAWDSLLKEYEQVIENLVVKRPRNS